MSKVHYKSLIFKQKIGDLPNSIYLAFTSRP